MHICRHVVILNTVTSKSQKFIKLFKHFKITMHRYIKRAWMHVFFHLIISSLNLTRLSIHEVDIISLLNMTFPALLFSTILYLSKFCYLTCITKVVEARIEEIYKELISVYCWSKISW